jgi:hypothetical protein
MKKCSRCEAVRYCSKECQLKDWPTHKGVCGMKKEEKVVIDRIIDVCKLVKFKDGKLHSDLPHYRVINVFGDQGLKSQDGYRSVIDRWSSGVMSDMVDDLASELNTKISPSMGIDPKLDAITWKAKDIQQMEFTNLVNMHSYIKKLLAPMKDIESKFSDRLGNMETIAPVIDVMFISFLYHKIIVLKSIARIKGTPSDIENMLSTFSYVHMDNKR